MNEFIDNAIASEDFTLTCNKCGNTDKEDGIIVYIEPPRLKCSRCKNIANLTSIGITRVEQNGKFSAA